jgi:uncharacterized protein with NAD-binding domain and iron-sulfur cluster
MTGKCVFIAGGGIAGMTAATVLAENGFQVTLCEAADQLGGKARSGRTTEGMPVEHSLRVYSAYYHALFTLLARIPAGNGRTVFDNLVGVDVVPVFADGPVGRWGRPRPVQPRRGPVRDFLGRLARPWRIALGLPLRAALFALVFRRHGVPLRESLAFLYKHLRLLWMCPERLDDELAGISYGEYLNLGARSAAFARYFGALPQVITAARTSAEARSIALMVLRILLHVYQPAPGFGQAPGVMMMNGPTSERFIGPWAAYLEQLGVDLRLSDGLADLTFSEDRIASARLRSGTRCTADHFVLALPYPALRRLCETTPLGDHAACLGELDRVGTEWSSGIQFFLRDLPDPPGPFAPGVVSKHLDTPWTLAAVVQGPGFWRDVSLPPPARYVLSVTWTTAHAPGVLTGKKATACTPEELVRECLAQCGCPPELVLGYRVDEEIQVLEESVYQAVKDRLPPHVAAEPHEGRRMINFAPLSILLPGADRALPGTCTEVENLFLAGEYVQAPFRVPTMEKAAQGGYLAAREVLRREAPGAAGALQWQDYDLLPFRFLRRIDRLLYRRRARSATDNRRPRPSRDPILSPTGRPDDVAFRP